MKKYWKIIATILAVLVIFAASKWLIFDAVLEPDDSSRQPIDQGGASQD